MSQGTCPPDSCVGLCYDMFIAKTIKRDSAAVLQRRSECVSKKRLR